MYNGKTSRNSYAEENMQRVLEDVIRKIIGYRKASQCFNVSQSVMEDRCPLKKYRRFHRTQTYNVKTS
jgi:hypothetical protein